MGNSYDIIVAGGGFSGVCAAVACARAGKSVLLVEKFNCLGGAACFDLVNPYMRYYKKKDEDGKTSFDKFLSDGIFTEIREETEKLGGAKGLHVFDEETLKLVLNRICVNAGVTLLFNSLITSVQKAGKRITSVTVSAFGRDTAFYADIFIDATGDANLAFLAGCNCQLGRQGDNLCQPMTLCFRLANVNEELYREERRQINPLYVKLQSEGKIKNPRENVLIFDTCHEGILHFNTTRVCGCNPTDAFEVTKAEIEAREQVFEMLSFLKENFTAFKDAELISTGMQIGARESRMVDGEYCLTEEDIVSCKKFEDGIAACNYDIDIHSPDGTGTYIYQYPSTEYYTVPYRCLVPKGIDNMLVAGRCISATHEAQSSFRIMPTCASIGEAAGTAAAICVENKCAPKEIDVDLLRNALRSNGAVVD